MPTFPIRPHSLLRRPNPSTPSTPSDPSQNPPPTPKNRRRKRHRSALSTLLSGLYHTTFYFFILVIAALLVGSAYGLGEQALRTGGQRRFNLFVLVAAYVVLGLVSIIHVWSRILSVKKILRSMPKPYMPTKQIDVPKKVANHITTEYSRTAVIAHISQATTGQQEGWGRPGTKWENQHFRTYILNTLPTMYRALCPHSKSTPHPLSLRPLLAAADGEDTSGAIKLFVNSYVRLIDQARFGRREPGEEEAMACERIVEVVLLTLEVKHQREKAEWSRKIEEMGKDQGEVEHVEGSKSQHPHRRGMTA